jgi:response regulator RpfG family c-di-GMP phosphodiesterase
MTTDDGTTDDVREATSLPLPPTPEPERRLHIYVINSDPLFLELIATLIEDTRIQVTLEQLRPNPAVTVDNLHSARPDLVILDVVPYQTAAATLLDLLEQDPALCTLPVMLASTSPEAAEQVANAYDQLVRDILPKPFDLDAFYVKVHRIAGHTTVS